MKIVNLRVWIDLETDPRQLPEARINEIMDQTKAADCDIWADNFHLAFDLDTPDQIPGLMEKLECLLEN